MAQKLRLQVALAQLGFSSRRGAKEIIQAGRVKVNGQPTFEPGYRVDLEKDTITVDDKRSSVAQKVYFILNKPKGVTSTVRDRYAARCVIDLVKRKDVRIYPVGRLDKDTTGLILLTNDGELTLRLTHPKFGIKRIYRIRIAGSISPENLKKLESGIFLEGKKTYPCKIKLIADNAFKTSGLEIQLTQGRKRQIKKMFAAVGHPVLAIERVAFGPLRLGSLKLGKWRPLKREEIGQLYKAAGAKKG